MAYRTSEQRIQLEDWWLDEPTEKYPYWGIKWYDNAAKQTRRVPARPKHDPKGHIRGVTDADRSTAYEALMSFVVKAKRERAESPTPSCNVSQPVQQHDISVLQALLYYGAGRGGVIVNKGKVKTTMKLVTRVWGDPTCRQLNTDMQEKLIAHLRAKNRTDRTIVDRLKMIWTAMYYARDKLSLAPDAVPPRLTGKKWDNPAKLRTRNVKLTDSQIVDMFVAAADPTTPEYIWRWLIIQVGAVCRPSAPLVVRRSNFDAEVGNLDLLETGAVQEDNKGKATIRCCPTLRGFLQQWSTEEVQTDGALDCDPLLIRSNNGKPITDLGFHKYLAEKAKVVLPKGTDSYIWRHTLITWLARHRVPEEQRKFMAGHRIADGSHGVYIHFEPAYMKEAVDAIEMLFAMVASKIPRGFRSLLPPVMVDSLEEQPAHVDVGQSYIHMLRNSSYLVANRGYSVADFSAILNGIKATSIAVEVSCGDS